MIFKKYILTHLSCQELQTQVIQLVFTVLHQAHRNQNGGCGSLEPR